MLRDGHDRAVTPQTLELAHPVVRVREHVMDMHRPALEGGPSDGRARCQGVRMFFVVLSHLRQCAGGTGSRREAQDLATQPVDRALLRYAEPPCALDQGFQDKLQIKRRAADDLEDLAGGGLLLEGLGELPGARLDLLLEVGVRLLKLDGCPIELLGQRLQLITGLHLDAMAEIAGADASRPIPEHADGRGHAPGQDHAGRDRQRQAEDEEQTAPDNLALERRERLPQRLFGEDEPSERSDLGEGDEDLIALEIPGHRGGSAVARRLGSLGAREADQIGRASCRERV